MSSASIPRRASKFVGGRCHTCRARPILNASQMHDRRWDRWKPRGRWTAGKKLLFFFGGVRQVGWAMCQYTRAVVMGFGTEGRIGSHTTTGRTRGYPPPFKRRHYQICLSQITHRLSAGPSRAKCDCFSLKCMNIFLSSSTFSCLGCWYTPFSRRRKKKPSGGRSGRCKKRVVMFRLCQLSRGTGGGICDFASLESHLQ